MIDAIRELMKKYHIDGHYQGGYGTSSAVENEDAFVLQFGDLPQLTFFMELAQICSVPLETILVESEDGGAGCDTCGYGAGAEITVRVPKGKP